MPRVFVAAGSNVEPDRNLARAFDELRREFAHVRVSPAYRNRAVGFEGPDFVNAVVELTTDLPLEALRERLRRIEALCGRAPDAPKWGPRAMDLDILLYGDLVRENGAVRLPRPDLLTRAYMLGPLADLAPELIHPTEGRSIGELWERFDRAAHPLVPHRIGGGQAGPRRSARRRSRAPGR